MAKRHLTFHFDPEQMAELKQHVDEQVADVLEQAAEQVRAAERLAGGCRSFMSSLPFCAPEAVGWQASVKIGGALAAYDALASPSTHPKED